MNKKTRRDAGFTLIEVMVVVVILAVLAGIIVPKIMDRPDAARLVKAQQDIRALESALSLYRLDHYQYPTTDEGLEALVSGAAGHGGEGTSSYLARLPSDPWGNEYFYLQPGEHGEFDIYTLGADGQVGGEGANADVGNWDL
uniref:Type II secretion system core protein G n=1 Tax=Candidatus Kentrum sp. FM TaxID=2126340 RepID=A0A450S4V4_9GAMM|nr:MAG: general secretion pathway protein G [Candidatus Kentron sp. FM]VFJ47270.1 MAG: general secretion pathway protein G [Candidatus Kentron sp. FM]VFK07156.1 MAG: general secretion pathway protein G [Candidatus Kentron sp. FM]